MYMFVCICKLHQLITALPREKKKKKKFLSSTAYNLNDAILCIIIIISAVNQKPNKTHNEVLVICEEQQMCIATSVLPGRCCQMDFELSIQLV